MSDKKSDKAINVNIQPTNFDLHIEQARQFTILEQVHSDIGEIKNVLAGENKRTGLIMDVDRLKRSSAFLKAFMWVIFTAFLGTASTVIITVIAK